MSSYLAVSPLPTTVETVAGGLLSVALFPDLAIGGRYPPSYPAESGLSSKERLATLSPRPSVRLLFFSFPNETRKTPLIPTRRLRVPFNYNLERVLFNAARPIFFHFLAALAFVLAKSRPIKPTPQNRENAPIKPTPSTKQTTQNKRYTQKTNALLRTRSFFKLDSEAGPAVKRSRRLAGLGRRDRFSR